MEPVWRFVRPREGSRGFVFNCASDRRIRQFAACEVLGVYRNGNHAEILVEGRQQRTVQLHHIDCGREFRLRSGQWIPESDPRARKWLLRLLADIGNGGTKRRQFRSDDGRTWSIEEIAWVLKRNGWDRAELHSRRGFT